MSLNGECVAVLKAILLLGFMLLSVEANSKNKYPYVSFMGRALRNHSFVDLSKVGANGNTSVQCITDLYLCCSTIQGPYRGDWYFPRGIGRLPFPGGGDIFEKRNNERVEICRTNNATSPTGIYRCTIATVAVHDISNPFMGQTVYVGLYNPCEGDIKMLEGISLVVNSDLNGPNPQFTLTCISTGGPATTVTWTRDSTILTEGTETVLKDAVTADYAHTLVVKGRHPGIYRCAVANNKPSSTKASLIIEVASSPYKLMLVAGNNPKSVQLSWTPPSLQQTTSGYRISYTGSSSGSVDVSGANTSIYTLKGLKSGATYKICVSGTSTHFNSENVECETITLFMD